MIIFGSRSINSTGQTGSFHCPRCGPNKDYAEKIVSRWFTLYFIPVIPLGRRGSYIQCMSCAGTFSQEALSYDPQAETARSLLKLRGIMALAMLANGHSVYSEAIQAICDFFQETTGTPLSEQEVRNDASHALAGNIKLATFAKQVAAELSFQGKGLFLRGCYRVLMAGPNPRSDASAVLAELALAFQLSSQQVQEILSR